MKFIKKISIVMLISLSLISCKDDAVEVFNVTVKDDTFLFTPSAGGAVMHFNLSDGHQDVFEVEVSYINNWGEKVVRTAHYLAGSIMLDGFTTSKQDIPVTIYLKNSNEVRSAPINSTFSTLELQSSVMLTTDNNISISSSWGGFKIAIADLFDATEGTLFVGFRGIDPLKGTEEDIIIKSLPIAEAQSLNVIDVFGEAVVDSDNISTVVLWVENSYSQLIARKEFKTEFLQTTKLGGESVVMQQSSIEQSVEEGTYSWKYLFDGDTNGQKSLENFSMHSFLSKDGMRSSEWIFDLGAPQTMAQVRLYTQYWSAVNYDDPWFVYYQGSNTNPRTSLVNKLPSDFEVYGQQEGSTEWELLGTYNSPRGSSTMPANAWYYNALGGTNTFDFGDDGLLAHQRVGFTSVSDIDGLPPVYALLSFDVRETKYRYVKLNVLTTFVFGPNEGVIDDYDSFRGYSYDGEQIAFSELEFYVKK